MQFAIAALLASAVSAARFPHAPLAGRSAATVSVTGADGTLSLLETLARPAAESCAGSPVALGNTCHATFQCSEAAVADPAVFEAAQNRLASAIGPVSQACICTCGTYCCPYCTFAVPEAVQVEGLGLTVTCA